MTYAIYAAIFVLASIALAGFVHMSYVYVMGYKYARDNDGVPSAARPFFFFTLGLMWPAYILFNWTLGNVFFFELNFHPQFTQRCDRHLAGPDSWRKRQAQFWCRNFLDPFDPAGGHCRWVEQGHIDRNETL